jgi:DNA primase
LSPNIKALVGRELTDGKVSRRYYSEDFIAELKSRADIVSLISEYVRLRRTGKNYVGLCPFHQEKTPSFSVDPDKQLFYCFGCGQGGNIFTFLMKIENLTFQDAVEELARRTGLPLPKAALDPEAARRSARAAGIRKALEFARDRYREMLYSAHGAKALKYLQGRGLSREIIDLFQLGYAPAGWDFVTQGALKAGIDIRYLELSGLSVRSRRGTYYDRFRNRIMFPIWDTRGELIGFAGRALGDETPKYLNSPDTPVFHKSRELYALHLAKPSIRSKGRVCVMEGYMDVISMFQNGIDYVVAGMGTAFSVEQARALLLLSDDVVLAYDQDEAGKKAVRRCIDVFREAGGRSRVVTFEGAKDPDEFVQRYGGDKFEELIENASPDIRFIFEEAARSTDISTVEGKLQVKDIMIPVLAALDSEFEISVYTTELSRKLDVRKESLERDVELYRRRARAGTRGYKNPKNSNTTGYDNRSRSSGKNHSVQGSIALGRQRAEEGIIRALVEKPELIRMASAYLDESDFAGNMCRFVYTNLASSPKLPEDHEVSSWIAEICAKFGPVDRPERVLMDCIRRLKEVRLRELREEMKLVQEAQDEQRLMAILNEYQELLRQAKSTRGDDYDSFPDDFPGREEG